MFMYLMRACGFARDPYATLNDWINQDQQTRVNKRRAHYSRRALKVSALIAKAVQGA